MELLKREDRGRVAWLTLSSPDNLNALSDGMMARLQEELDSLKDDSGARAVVIKGAGKAFCAGHDLREMTQGRQAEDAGESYFSDLFRRCSKMMLSIQSLPQPVIAQVHGIATAAGCQLVATCDLAVAAEGTRFGVNGVNIGLFCSTPMVALSRNIPRKRAFEMLTTGRFIEAGEALELGLVNKVVPEGELGAETGRLAEAIAGKLGSAVKTGKEAFYRQLHMSTEEAYEYAGRVMVENTLNSDTAEGISAFLEKRAPDWPG